MNCKIIQFPGPAPKLSEKQINDLTSQIIYDLFRTLREQRINTKNMEFIRDAAIIRKMLEAALLRQAGVDTKFTRMLDEIFESMPPQ
jgi:hypothetical protein